ncbi:MAG: ATP-dependent DNA ligase [Candidatus ainarchaeum sp.]|nr:ATP-dependent DNA ligase [Candidatus ainarchaeum sp.]
MIKMLFITIAEYFDKIENVSSRLEMTDYLAELFEKTNKEEIKKIIYLLQGQVAPTFEGKEIGFGEKLIAEGISKATGFTRKEIEESFSKKGDLGEVVEEMLIKKSQGSLFTKELTLKKVFENFEKMSLREGIGSQETKIKLLAELFNSSTQKEAKYIARIPLGNIRLGVGDPTIMDSIAIMIAKQEKNWLKLKEEEKRKIKQKLREKIEKAYNVYSDLGEISEIIKEKGINGLKKVEIKTGTPIRPTAAERLPSAKEIIKKLGKCAVEAKYDGFRILISKDDNEIKIFSRQSENITKMFPEIIEAVKQLKSKKLFIEGEALAFNEETNEYYPFQITIQRKRKYDVEKKAKEYPLQLFLFDIVYLEGKNLMEKPFKERRKILESIIKENEIIKLSEMKIINSAKELEKFFEEKISQGLEGIMAKDLDAPYIAGARKFSWIKLKRSYKGNLDDTLDLVIIGYYTGKGKRTQFGLGALLVAAYNKEKDLFESIAKIGTGMTEEILKELEERLSKIKTIKNVRIISELKPDYWVEPKIVIEVRADEITKSPLHSCAKEETGLALRFPRMIKFRNDKKPEQATTTNEVKQMYSKQKKVSVELFGQKE